MKKLISTLFAAVMLITTLCISASATVKLPSISSSKPISCYTLSSGGKVYTYTDSTLKKKDTSHYIDCKADLCRIVQISGKAVKVKYPVGSSYNTAWFARSDFTSCNISSGATESWVQAKKISTVYKWSSGSTWSGSSVSAGDTCYKLAVKGNYTQIIYPVSGGYKMGWVKTSDISKKSTQTTSKKALADVAAAEIGTKGVDKNGNYPGDYTKYGKWIGNDGVQWCASFVSWCVNQAGVSTKIVPKTSSCATMKNNSNSYHAWSSSALKSIKKNDVIFFANSANGAPDHVGIVYSVSGSNIAVIEGNTGSYYGPDIVKKITYTVDSSSGKITKGYNGKYFCGYISVS